jgi:hypothetical protein
MSTIGQGDCILFHFLFKLSTYMAILMSLFFTLCLLSFSSSFLLLKWFLFYFWCAYSPWSLQLGNLKQNIILRVHVSWVLWIKSCYFVHSFSLSFLHSVVLGYEFRVVHSLSRPPVIRFFFFYGPYRDWTTVRFPYFWILTLWSNFAWFWTLNKWYHRRKKKHFNFRFFPTFAMTFWHCLLGLPLISIWDENTNLISFLSNLCKGCT